MSDNIPNAAISAKQVELAISRLECLSTLPCVAAQYIPRITKSQFQPSIISDIIEADPLLTARILSLITSFGMNISDKRFSISNAVDKLPVSDFREAMLSIKASPVLDITEQTPDKKGLYIHSLAVACYAKAIAGIMPGQMDLQTAYFAGLLHDIGKFVLVEIMPRSYYRIIEQARKEEKSSRVIEQQQMGMNHTLVGKHLAVKWQFPELITLSIWLHHSITANVLHEMPEAKIAAVVQIADSLARQAGLGDSGSFDLPETAEPMLNELKITQEKLLEIPEKVSDEVKKKVSLLGLDIPDASQKYMEIVQNAALQFSKRDIELSEENRRLQSDSGHFNFIKDFLTSIKTGDSAADIARNFACRWQKFFQTGKVCLYFAPSAGSQLVEAAVVENFSQSDIILLNVPIDNSVIPKNIENSFAIINADDHIKWLSEQLEEDFDVSRTRLVPLLFGTKMVGIIVFELYYPGDIKFFEEKFRTSASIAAIVLAEVLEKRKEQIFAESFVQLIKIVSPENNIKTENKDKTEEEEFSLGYSLNALAELAAGAAHELNNPLAVISGRAQLLAEAEQNQEKKQILQQIQQNANEASEIIEDLMSFAEPPQPRPTKTSVSQLIDEALQLASMKVKVEKINAQIETTENVENIFIDSAQIVSSIANIICNAVESYQENTGLIKIDVQPAESNDFLKLSIEDCGSGMSRETLKKATQPFFSAKPAGRKRGMGLAYAARLIQLNKGSLSITSELGKGTIVIIYLPYK